MSDLRILVTGSRHAGSDHIHVVRHHLSAVVQEWFFHGIHDRVMIVHGGARGVDTIAGEWATDMGWWQEIHEVTNVMWRTVGPAAGPNRNQRMVDAGADVCVAFPLGRSTGTRDCTHRATSAGIHTKVHPLDKDKVVSGKIVKITPLDDDGNPVGESSVLPGVGVKRAVDFKWAVELEKSGEDEHGVWAGGKLAASPTPPESLYMWVSEPTLSDLNFVLDGDGPAHISFEVGPGSKLHPGRHTMTIEMFKDTFPKWWAAHVTTNADGDWEMTPWTAGSRIVSTGRRAGKSALVEAWIRKWEEDRT